MKFILSLFTLALLISCKENKNGFIEFRHVGECDKYIESLRIVKKETPPALITTDIIVNEKTFERLVNYLNERCKNELNVSEEGYSYGSFKITISKDTADDFWCVLDNRKQSLVFFQQLVEYLKQNNMDKILQSAINTYIIHRIENPARGFPEH